MTAICERKTMRRWNGIKEKVVAGISIGICFSISVVVLIALPAQGAKAETQTVAPTYGQWMSYTSAGCVNGSANLCKSDASIQGAGQKLLDAYKSFHQSCGSTYESSL